MSSTILQKTMKATGQNVVDVAAATKVHPQTVTNYLKGKRVHKSTEMLLKQWVASNSKTGSGGNAA